MRKNLERVPVYAPIGDITANQADSMVAAGRGHSLRGKALMLFDTAHLEQLLSDLDIPSETMAIILRAAARVDSERAAAPAVRFENGAKDEHRVG